MERGGCRPTKARVEAVAKGQKKTIAIRVVPPGALEELPGTPLDLDAPADLVIVEMDLGTKQILREVARKEFERGHDACELLAKMLAGKDR